MLIAFKVVCGIFPDHFNNPWAPNIKKYALAPNFKMTGAFSSLTLMLVVANFANAQ